MTQGKSTTHWIPYYCYKIYAESGTELLSVDNIDNAREITSPGITSPFASELVNNVLTRVATEHENAAEHSESPTSPFANQMVDDLMLKISGEPDTARTDVSVTFTNVTDNESGDKTGTL